MASALRHFLNHCRAPVFAKYRGRFCGNCVQQRKVGFEVWFVLWAVSKVEQGAPICAKLSPGSDEVNTKPRENSCQTFAHKILQC